MIRVGYAIGGETTGLKDWVPFAKGGDFCRFYSDIDLVIDWKPEHRDDLKASGNALPSEDMYFKPGLTWPRAAAVFNVRVLPAGCVFADKGPAIFPATTNDTWYLAAVLNSDMVLCFAKTLTSRENMGGRWEVGVVKKFPIPIGNAHRWGKLTSIAKSIYERKRNWNAANEICRDFEAPWLLRERGASEHLADLLDCLELDEQSSTSELQSLASELNTEVFLLYGVPQSRQRQILETLGDRPVEVIWPQMEGKSREQKRMEHVWRLLSYVVKRILEGDLEAIVPLSRPTGDARLVDRVRNELAVLFENRDEGQLEVEIVNELKRPVKGYRKCSSLDDWLTNAFFEHHVTLYKNRPIFWHVASSQGAGPCAFGALLHYHRLDKNCFAKLRSSFVRDTMEELRREVALADRAGRADDRVELQAKLEEVQSLDKRLQLIQEGHHEGPEGGERDFRILTPWKEPSARPRGWDPDLDDGVKVNIAPLDRAGVLRVVGVAR